MFVDQGENLEGELVCLVQGGGQGAVLVVAYENERRRLVAVWLLQRDGEVLRFPAPVVPQPWGLGGQFDPMLAPEAGLVVAR